MALQRGDVVDRYRLEEPLGAGAFGEVWKASQLANGEPIGITCALKVMRLVHDRAGSSPRALPSGWLDEAQYLVRVAGSTVPRIHEANVWNGHAYIAMELLDGATLRSRLAHGPIPWRRALFVADQIATALEAAHKIGLIHRDLKPQNVMLAGPQRCCVLDWGIARLHTSSAPFAESGLERQSTEDIETTDAVPVPVIAQHPQRMPVGTPGYMAPEVYDGAHPGPAQDVYSLGVVLYEMIAGCLPHAVEPVQRARATPDSMKAYRVSLDRATMDHSLVPLRERCSGVPVAVAELVDALLERDPEHRPTKLRAAIEHASRFSHGIPDPPYVGLSTLGLQHAGLYFGQRDAVQGILNYLTSQRAALLWGPSGSGKSSLALAGVAATMDRTLFLDMDGWDIHVIRPRDSKSFRATSETAPARPAIGQVVVLDQLEEVVDLEPAARDVFCSAVLALLDRSAPVVIRDTTIGITDDVKLIATIRDDLEWRVDREAPALRPLLDRRVIVKGVDVNLVRSIIEEPARALGYKVEGIAAVTREVEERLSAEPAKLPVVQYALSEWWERRDHQRKALPLAAWNELGGVDGALSFVAERFFSRLDQVQQQRVRALFVQLFRGGRKQPLVESGLGADGRFVMEELGRLRLVGRHEKKGSEPFYEVEHEYLAANWTRLAGWLAEARDDRALADELERDAAAYLRDQDPERLWRKGRLAAAMEMAGRGRIVLDQNTTQFLHQARRRERRGRLVLRVSVGIAVAVVLGVVYMVVLQAAASDARKKAITEAAQAESERHLAEEARRRASQLESNATGMLERAKQQVDQQILNAKREAARMDEEAALRLKTAQSAAARTDEEATVRLRAAKQEVEQAKESAQAERNAAVKSRQDQEKQLALLKSLEQSAINNASAAAERARTAEQRAQAAEKRQSAACGTGSASADR